MNLETFCKQSGDTPKSLYSLYYIEDRRPIRQGGTRDEENARNDHR